MQYSNWSEAQKRLLCIDEWYAKDFNWSAFVNDYVAKRRPLVIRNFVSEWPLVKRGLSANSELASCLMGYANDRSTATFECDTSVAGRFGYNDQLNGFNFQLKKQSIKKTIDQLIDPNFQASGRSLYAGSAELELFLPGLIQENYLLLPLSRALQELPNARIAEQHLRALNSCSPRIWIGNATRISAHFDNPENIACVVSGEREFTLFPTEQIENLYIGPIDFTPAGQSLSLVDFHSPDFERFPQFSDALDKAQFAKLSAGDAIYIPSLWWHHVEGVGEFNVLMNYWWSLEKTPSPAPYVALINTLLALNEFDENKKNAWKTVFDFYLSSAKDISFIPEQARGILGELSDEQAMRFKKLLLKSLSE